MAHKYIRDVLAKGSHLQGQHDWKIELEKGTRYALDVERQHEGEQSIQVYIINNNAKHEIELWNDHYGDRSGRRYFVPDNDAVYLHATFKSARGNAGEQWRLNERGTKGIDPTGQWADMSWKAPSASCRVSIAP